MKRNHIIALVLIAVAVGAILSTLGDASTYVTFDQAENDQGATYTVIGTLDTTMEMHYEPRTSLFTFYAQDKQGGLRKVYYPQPKPQDFERAEEVTMKGYAKEGEFYAEEILMKCPSKYNGNQEIAESSSDQVYYE
jgi:cytochrome c-type biogenesis protein CcmE